MDAILEHNTFYHSDGIATLYFDGGEKTLAAMQKDYKKEKTTHPILAKLQIRGLTIQSDKTIHTVRQMMIMLLTEKMLMTV